MLPMWRILATARAGSSSPRVSRSASSIAPAAWWPTKTCAVIDADKLYRGQRFSETETHFVCPWHGYEYDLATGECAADRRRRLRKFDVVTKEEAFYVVV
jgi:hypothetical protein